MGKVARNTTWLFSSQLVSKGVGLIYVLYLARRLGVAAFGQYQMVLAFVFIFFTLVDFGLNRFLIRDLSRKLDQTGSYLGNALGFRLVLAVFAYLFALVGGFLLGYPRLVIRLIALASLVLFSQGSWLCFEAVFLAKEMVFASALGTIILAVANPILGILLLQAGWGVGGILGGMVFSNLIVLGYFGFLAKIKRIAWRFSLDKELSAHFLKEGSKFAFLTVLSLFYLKNGIIILGWLKGEEAVGLYSAAYKIVEVGILFPNALALAFFPQVSRLVVSQKEKLTRVYLRSVIVASLLALPLAMVANLCPARVLTFLFGQEYSQAAAAFSVLGFSLILFFVNALPGTIIQSSPRLTSFLPWAFLNSLLNFGLNLFFIPRLSLLGAAYAILVTEITGLVINNVFVIKILRS